MLNRLVIGTANFGREYNGHCVSETEQQLIMEYMKEVGIEWLDVATAYGTETVGNLDFNKIIKVGRRIVNKEDENQCIVLAHDIKDYNPKIHNGVSVYRVTDIPLGSKLPHYLEIPYSIMDDNAGCLMMSRTSKLIARSIFCKGKALQHFSPRECLDFVLMNPKIDKVIIGVDSVDQLRSNVEHLVKMEQFTTDEEVDTRKF